MAFDSIIRLVPFILLKSKENCGQSQIKLQSSHVSRSSNPGVNPVERKAWALAHLPPGHVEIMKSQEEVNKEYESCAVIERAFSKKWKSKRSFQSFQESANFSALLCVIFGTKPIKMAKQTDKSWAYYNGVTREIFICSFESVIVVIHETVHHICWMEGLRQGGSHGSDFCMIEQMLFDWLLKNKPEI